MARITLRNHGRFTASAACLFLLLLLLIACSKVTTENYRKIQIGMPYPQIVQLLGEPTRCDSLLTAKTCTWGSKGKTIDIQFVADQVVLFFEQRIVTLLSFLNLHRKKICNLSSILPGNCTTG